MPAVRAIHPSTPNSGRILRIDQCRSSPFALIEIQDHSGRTIPAEPDPVTDHHLARLATENRTVAVRHAGRLLPVPDQRDHFGDEYVGIMTKHCDQVGHIAFTGVSGRGADCGRRTGECPGGGG